MANMQDLLELQNKAVAQLNRYITNFGKDSKTTKNEASYFEKKLQQLEEWWVAFDGNNTKLIPMATDDEQYFKDKAFDKVREIYLSHRTKLQDANQAQEAKKTEKLAEERRKQAEKDAREASSSKSFSLVNLAALEKIQGAQNAEIGDDSDDERDPIGDMQMNGLNSTLNEESAVIRVLKFQFDEVKSALMYAGLLNQNVSTGMASAQLENLKQLWAEFRESYRTVSVSEHREKIAAINFRSLQEKYLTIFGKLNDLANCKVRNKMVNLPQLKIPEFSGDSREWRSFKDIFDKIVHDNVTISNDLKIQYLKTYLRGKAAKLVSHIAPNEENYETCYQILSERYENKRENLEKYIDEIIKLENLKSASSDGLKKIHDTTHECIMAIHNIQISTENWDYLLVHILMKKLDPVTIVDYEGKLADVKEPQKLKDFLSYLERRSLALASAEAKNDKVSDKNDKNEKNESYEKYEKRPQKKYNEGAMKCSFCSGSHSVYTCSELKKYEPAKRFEKVKEKKLCFVCLQAHKIGECNSKFKCKLCDKKHSTLLHFEKKSAANEPKNAMCTTTEIQEKTEELNVHMVSVKSKSKFLATAWVRVLAKSGEKFLLRALIDDCSESSFITERAMQLLKLCKTYVSASVAGVGAEERKLNGLVELAIFSRFNDEFCLETEAVVMKKITNYNKITSDLTKFEHLRNLRLADGITDGSEPVDILLGTAEHGIIIKPGLVKGAQNEPIARDSELGWLVSGGYSDARSEVIKVNSMVSNIEISNKLDSFFASNDVDDNSDDEGESCTDEEKYFEEFFRETTIRDDKGFIVRMPFKNKTEPQFGDSKKVALATLFQMEKRFKGNAQLKKEYTAAINDAIEKGHMKKIEVQPANAYFLPHHAVFKESTTTKLRTVFNASQKSSNGLSLNDTMAMGKIKQPKILELLIRWRQYRIAVVGDIEKMYKQIRIADDQQHLLLILWRNEVTGRIEIYALTTVTFGVANAPCTAIRVLRALADEVREKYPSVSRVIEENYFVDDCMAGEDTVAEAIGLYDDMKITLLSGGFNMRKINSNSDEFLKHVPDGDKELGHSNVLKALGVVWCPANDAFEQKFQVKEETVPTKRGLVSQVASLYDPLGLIAPVITKAKLIIQEVWQLSNTKKDDWDDRLPNEIVEKWEKIKTELPILSDISIPRWIGTRKGMAVQLHGFCDASEKAYAAVVYVRYRDDDGNYQVSLVMAKSKVAPIKTLKIPKLELMGALLLANLVKKVMRALNVEFERVFLWCDSKIVLAWIKGNPKRWKTFVASRVLKIDKKTNKNDWYHVKGPENPADCASRGIMPHEMGNHALWWTGPKFLKDPNFEQKVSDNFETNEEILINTHVVTEKPEFLPECTSFRKLKRVFVYVLRFIANARCKTKMTGKISFDELQQAEEKIIRSVQHEFYSDEFESLLKGKALKKSSNLIALGVFVDMNGRMRVGGRLRNSLGLSYDQKHPILVPHKSVLSKMIIMERHRDNLHAGPKLLEAKIRENFWITNIRASIKKHVKKCVTCVRFKAKTLSQLMGNLPQARVSVPKKVFENCAIDFAGPISTKSTKLRTGAIIKSYIAIFVCLATKALHIEAVSDLTADSFIAALRRCIGRRGKISNIYSDNGSNFVKANRILNELLEAQEEEFERELHEESIKLGIKWHFSPPASAHFNGLVEAAVKSTKYHLYRALQNVNVTFEELSTLLCQVESVLNSRPICELSADPNDLGALTPAQLLNVVTDSVPEEDLSETKSNYLTRWELVQKLAQEFWKKWQMEYLHQLQVRNKWHEKKPDIKVDELVVIKDTNLPSCKWQLGRVVELHPGNDGLVRVVTVRTASNTLKRGITELAPLPIRQ